MVSFQYNYASSQLIRAHLERVSPLFKPELSSYVNLDLYAQKIYEKAERVEVWDDDRLVGLIAYYININDSYAFITNVSLEKEYSGQGIAGRMMDMMQEYLIETVQSIKLEVKVENTVAIRFYRKHGFTVSQEDPNALVMIKMIGQ